MYTACLLYELLLVDCSIQLGRPQRRLCRQISFLSVEQCSRCWTPSGDESVPRITVTRLHRIAEVVWAAACVDCEHHQCQLELDSV